MHLSLLCATYTPTFPHGRFRHDVAVCAFLTLPQCLFRETVVLQLM